MKPVPRRFSRIRLLLSVVLLGALAGALAFGLRDEKAPTHVIAIADETAAEFDPVSIPERYPIALGSVGSARGAGTPPLQYPFLCESERSGLGQPRVDNRRGHGVAVYAEGADGERSGHLLGFSRDCGVATRVDYYYKPVGAAHFQPLGALALELDFEAHELVAALGMALFELLGAAAEAIDVLFQDVGAGRGDFGGERFAAGGQGELLGACIGEGGARCGDAAGTFRGGKLGTGGGKLARGRGERGFGIGGGKLGTVEPLLDRGEGVGGGGLGRLGLGHGNGDGCGSGRSSSGGSSSGRGGLPLGGSGNRNGEAGERLRGLGGPRLQTGMFRAQRIDAARSERLQGGLGGGELAAEARVLELAALGGVHRTQPETNEQGLLAGFEVGATGGKRGKVGAAGSDLQAAEAGQDEAGGGEQPAFAGTAQGLAVEFETAPRLQHIGEPGGRRRLLQAQVGERTVLGAQGLEVGRAQLVRRHRMLQRQHLGVGGFGARELGRAGPGVRER